MKIAVLMYHAIDEGDLQGADPHYTVSLDAFGRHLELFRREGVHASSVRDLLSSSDGRPSVAITFDDGHVSNFDAACRLQTAGMSADFFVNPETVGTTGFLDWSALREMHSMGMSIQSHGMSHRYLNDLTHEQVMTELGESRRQIETEVQSACSLFAPPGGREPSEFLSVLASCGYQAACTSRYGYWNSNLAGQTIPRLAVLAGTSDDTISQWVRTDRLALMKLQCRGAVLGSIKRAVGNRAYDRFRERVLG